MADEPDPAPPAEPTPAAGAGEGLIRTPKFRRGLLAKLPKLVYRDWTVKDDFDLDDEWAASGAVHSDAILSPLEPMAPDYLK